MSVGNLRAASFQKERMLKTGLGNSHTKLAQETRLRPHLRKSVQWAESDYADDIVAHKNDCKIAKWNFAIIFIHI